MKSEGSEGGFGLTLINECSDAVRFRALDSGNRCSLYFFSDPDGLPFPSLLWAGELLEARVAGESMMDWCKWSLTDALDGSDFPLIMRAVALVESFEKSGNGVAAFHNTMHFRDVLISVCHAVEHSERRLSSDEVLGLALAAILHDYGHPGRASRFPGEIEATTLALLETEFWVDQAVRLSPASGICFDMIRATSPVEQAQHEELGRLFNRLDVGSSFIPWLGLTHAKTIALELGASQPQDTWEAFLEYWRAVPIDRPEFIEAWRTKTCSVVLDNEGH